MVSSLVNTAVLFGSAGIGLLIGWFVLGGRSNAHKNAGYTEEKEVSTNIAILYVTLTLAILTVATNWPPENIDFVQYTTLVVLFGSIFATAVIAGRVLRLIANLEEF